MHDHEDIHSADDIISGRVSLRTRIKRKFVQWLIQDVPLQGAKFGLNTITLSPAGVGDVARWSGTQAAAALGDLGMNVTTGRPSAFIGGSARDLLGDHEIIQPDGSVTFTANQPMGGFKITGLGEPTAGSSDAATASYIDSRIAAQVDAGGAGVGFIGTGTITEINAATPATGDVVVAEDAGTPSAGTSSALVAGDVAEYDGTSWLKIIDAVSNFPPDGTRVLVSESAFISGGGVTDATDEGKIAIWDGAALAPASFTTPTDGRIVVVKDDDSVNDSKTFVFDGVVPTGSWVLSAGIGADHGALSGLSDDDHTIYALLAGRAGGQSLIGGTASGEDLTLESTSNATKGDIIIASGTNVQVAGDDDIVPATTNEGRIGTSSLKFKEVNATTVTSGDHDFVDPDLRVHLTMREGRTRFLGRPCLEIIDRATGTVSRLPMRRLYRDPNLVKAFPGWAC